ncbi:PepSY-associated TM helix domain-containing protein [Caulobacter sp. SSI4214]|uniref:PepSY-associated TM helix domain-containing protein n=1 Tax=Caulobacter sp. SSI4214 TaxID=2575739 RepID=UPI00143BFCCA|nr:PepSY-associated TM helix domain-containing protein [Caulobacter sp. SSI4214]
MSGVLNPRGVAVLAHRWAGLVIGALWAVQGLTGALLVFQPQLERLAHRPFSIARLASLDQLTDAAQAAAGAPIRRLALPDRAVGVVNSDYLDAGGKRRFVRLDAESARVVAVTTSALGVAAPATGWGWVRSVHERALLSQGGAGLIAASGAFLITGVLIGAWLGWPRPGKWRVSFDVARWRNPAQRRYGWHRAVGLLAAGPLVIIAGTGVYMATLDLNPSRAVPAVLTAPPIGPQRAYEIAHARFPEAVFSSLQFPTQTRGVYAVRLTQPTEVRRRSGRTLVEVDARTGHTAKIYDPLNAPLAARLSDLVLPIHYGEMGGLIGKVLAAAAGLSLPALYGLGLWIWLARRGVLGRRKQG